MRSGVFCSGGTKKSSTRIRRAAYTSASRAESVILPEAQMCIRDRAASAMEFRREGLVLGLGSRLFTVAGPVLAYGITASILVGIIYWIVGKVI